MLQLTATKAAYDQRTAPNGGQPTIPPTPFQPRAGPGRIQRLPADGEPVPKAA